MRDHTFAFVGTAAIVDSDKVATADLLRLALSVAANSLHAEDHHRLVPCLLVEVGGHTVPRSMFP